MPITSPRACAAAATAAALRKQPARMGRPSSAANTEMAEPFGDGCTRCASTGMAARETGDSE